MKKLLLLLGVIVVALHLQAQKEFNDPNAELRGVKGFHGISVSNAIDLYLSQSNDETVAVSAAEPRYRDRIRTEVENGVLKIWFDSKGMNWWNNTGGKKLKAYVSFKTLDRLVASGAVNVRVTGNIKSDNLTIRLSGASDFRGAVDVNTLSIDQSGASDAEIKGRAAKLTTEASGASQFKGYDLETEECTAHANGASDIRVTVNKELNAHASGASGIYYRGNGVIRDLHSTGASRVSKKS